MATDLSKWTVLSLILTVATLIAGLVIWSLSSKLNKQGLIYFGDYNDSMARTIKPDVGPGEFKKQNVLAKDTLHITK